MNEYYPLSLAKAECLIGITQFCFALSKGSDREEPQVNPAAQADVVQPNAAAKRGKRGRANPAAKRGKRGRANPAAQADVVQPNAAAKRGKRGRANPAAQADVVQPNAAASLYSLEQRKQSLVNQSNKDRIIIMERDADKRKEMFARLYKRDSLQKGPASAPAGVDTSVKKGT